MYVWVPQRRKGEVDLGYVLRTVKHSVKCKKHLPEGKSVLEEAWGLAEDALKVLGGGDG